MCVDKMVERAGGRVVRTKVGDVYITEEMRKLNAVFGGEPCGAWVHPTFHHCPDGIVSALMVMTALQEQDISLSEFVAKVPQYKIVRKNLACPNEFKFTVVEEMLEKLKMIFPDYVNLSTVDGVRLRLREGWILVRASGTEPAVRLTVEGESLRTANRIMRRGREIAMKYIREVSN
jgi:phosphoglucosamine mutase